ncbi:MAG: DUF2335 domain-containing protein, partial [bacterium]
MNKIPDKFNQPQKDQNTEKNKAFLTQLVDDLEESNPDLFKDVQNKEQVVSEILAMVTQTVEIEHQEHHSGPLPHPRTLKEYNSIIENGAERIVTVFEKQSDHRMQLEKKVITSQTTQSLLGQIFGFVIAIVFLIAGIYLVVNGHEAAGITIFGLDIVGLVTVFVIGKRKQKKDL